MVKLVALEDDSKVLSEVSLFLGFFFSFALGTKERGVTGGGKGTQCIPQGSDVQGVVL